MEPRASSARVKGEEAAEGRVVGGSWTRADQVWAFLLNHLALIAFVGVCTSAHLTLFTARIWQLSHAPWCERFARASGLCLNLSCALVLVLMLRRCITWLRCRGFGSALPLDHHVLLHKMAGWVTCFLSLVHTATHFINIAYLSYHRASTGYQFSFTEYLFSTRPGIGWVCGAANGTGLALLVILLIMVAFSQPCVRRNGCFEVFYWTHLLYVAFWSLLVIHAPHFWKWFLVPGLVYLAELLVRIHRRSNGRTLVVQGIVLPSRVTQLIIRRPDHFHFRPGDYVLVNLPLISRHEWHPFTISSAPEQTDLLSLHVRAVGEWTTGVLDYFASRQNAPEAPVFTVDGVPRTKYTGSSPLGHGDVVGKSPKRHPFAFFRNHGKYVVAPEPPPVWQPPLVKGNFSSPLSKSITAIDVEGPGIEIFLDGPYGTPSSGVLSVRHAVLVAAGIGVTPYASVLQSLLLSYWAAHRKTHPTSVCQCPPESQMGVSTPAAPPVKLSSVHFIWINRDLTNLDWFVELLSHLKRELARRPCPLLGRFLTVDLYVTRQAPTQQGKSMWSTLPYELKDSIHAGRPQWEQVLSRIADGGRRRKVTVFCCGPRSLKRQLRLECARFGFNFKKEAF